MSFLARAQHALDALGPSAALSGLSAARLHGLVLVDPGEVDVLVPWVPRSIDLPGVRVRRTRGTGRRPALAEPLPHTDIVDTVLDLTDRTDAETCVYWLTEATRRGLVTMEQLLEALAERHRHRHRRLIHEIAEDIASGATSNLEVRYAKGVEREHGLPRAVRQLIVPETGHRSDFGYPAARLLIEADGRAYHEGEAAARDQRLDAEHAAAGWRTLRYTWSQVVGSPCELAREVAAALAEAGHPCDVHPCPAEQRAA